MSNNNTPFVINGYNYADAKITFNGIDLPGITSFDLSPTQTKTNNYGLGGNPVSRSRGNKEYTGNLEMDYDTMNLLAVLSPTGLLIDIPVGILILSLVRPGGGKEIATANFTEFMGDGLGGTQGDENLTKSIDIIFGSYSKISL